jgi:hypothetical protein
LDQSEGCIIKNLVELLHKKVNLAPDHTILACLSLLYHPPQVEGSEPLSLPTFSRNNMKQQLGETPIIKKKEYRCHLITQQSTKF